MITFVTKKNARSTILSVDPVRFAELEEDNLDHFLMRFVFKIKLNVASIDPTIYNKVDVSILKPQTTSNISKLDETRIKLNPNFSHVTSTLTKTNSSKLKFNSAGQKIFKPDVSIPKTALDRINKNLSVLAISRINNKSTPYMTKVPVLISQTIKNALEQKCLIYQLEIPAEVSLEQGIRLTQDKILNSNIIKDINDNFKIPSTFINSLITPDSLFGKKIIDYFIHDVNQPTETFLGSLNFFRITTNFTNLSELEIPVRIKIPSLFKNADLTVKFDLFENSSELPLESIQMSLNTKKYFESYYALSSTPNVDYTTTKEGTGAILAFSYDAFDKNKVTSFNIYLKTLINGKFTKLRFFTNIDVSELSFKQSIFALKNFSTNSLAIARVVPVTKFGESEKFTDIVIGNGKTGSTGKTLILKLTQDSNVMGSVRATIDNISNLAESMKIYKRDCTNSAYADFKHMHTVRCGGNSSTSFVDSGLIPNHFYEYYIECIDNSDFDNIVQTSESALIEILRFQKDSSIVTLTNTVTSNDTVTFTIKTVVDKTTASLINDAVIALDASTQQTRVTQPDTTTVTNENLYFHDIVRITNSTGERYSMGIIADGIFIDNAEKRKILGNIPPPIPGSTYNYQITTYKKDLLSANKNRIVTGRKNNNEWFFLPYKWANPKVQTTGMLFSEDKNEIPEISDREFLLAKPVSVINSFKVTMPTLQKSFLISPIVTNISRKTNKIQWSLITDFNFDSFVVVKVVNGKRTILGSTNKNYFYHKLEINDLGTVYYEVTPIEGHDYEIQRTYFSNSIFVFDDTSERSLRKE